MKNSPLGMDGKNCIITGGNRGIGKQVATEIAKMGANIGIITRNRIKGEKAVNEIISDSKNNQITLFVTDIASQEQLKQLSKEIQQKFSHIDVLVNNAAVLLRKREETEDGIERTLATNHLGPFLLVNLLFKTLEKSKSARVINISSDGHRKAEIDIEDLNYTKRKYSGFKAYYQSKLLNLLFTYELTSRIESLSSSIILVNALDPGRVNTDIGKNYDTVSYRIFSKLIRPVISISVHQGAETPIYLATSREVNGVSGKYFINRKISKSSRLSYDRPLQKSVWKLSENYVGINSEDYGVGDSIE
ncbi:short-chain dehydrogenase [Candidatus Heimdallarchaeota archaeon B3_Heim]|nr:MAG: short-chain dehydrogenase [Candidatus Heimdallarchaeota archaeon B3_Heim]